MCIHIRKSSICQCTALATGCFKIGARLPLFWKDKKNVKCRRWNKPEKAIFSIQSYNIGQFFFNRFLPTIWRQKSVCWQNLWHVIKRMMDLAPAFFIRNNLIIYDLKQLPKLYIPSTLNTDYLLWHTQLIVCAVKC